MIERVVGTVIVLLHLILRSRIPRPHREDFSGVLYD